MTDSPSVSLKGKPNVYKGLVSSVWSVTKNRAQIQLEHEDQLFELFIDQSWAINKGDSITLTGKKDETGKVCCYSYRNDSLGVNGYAVMPSDALFFKFLKYALVFIIFVAWLVSSFDRPSADADGVIITTLLISSPVFVFLCWRFKHYTDAYLFMKKCVVQTKLPEN